MGIPTGETTNRYWQEMRDAYVPRGVANSHPAFVVRARGAEMFDVEGRRYIDFIGGIGTLNVGSANPEVIRFLPPLVIEDEVLDEGLRILGEAMEEVFPGLPQQQGMRAASSLP